VGNLPLLLTYGIQQLYRLRDMREAGGKPHADHSENNQPDRQGNKLHRDLITDQPQ
jgi:hypothetical protein